MAGTVDGRELVGRTAELDRLDATLERALGGAATGVLLGGEAGIGKSRLLDELLARGRSRHARVLVGRCVDLEDAAIPLLAVTDALAPLATLGEPLPPELAGLVGGGEPWTPGTAGLGPQRVFAAVADLIGRHAAVCPVVLALEDLQWADRTTLSLLTFLLRRLRDERLLVVATFRSEEVDGRDGLRGFLADAARARAVERLELGPLAAADAATRLQGLLGATADPGWTCRILARAEGNPLFLEQLAGLAPSRGDAIPLTLQDMFLTRLRRVSPAAQQAVQAAAVGGRRVHHGLVASACLLPADELNAGLREAVRAGLLVAEGPGYAFGHVLVREAAYGELLPGERATLHARMARALDAHPELASASAAARAAESARHWQQAGDPPRALAATFRAACEADRLHAPAEAAEHYGRVLDAWQTVDGAAVLLGADHVEVLSRAGNATAACGRHAQAAALLGRAIGLIDAEAEPVRAGLLHERRGTCAWFDGRGGLDAVADYREAVRLIPEHPPSSARAGAVARLGLMLLLAGYPAPARVHCADALAVARTLGARLEEAEALVGLGAAQDALGERPAAIASLGRALELARAVGAPLVSARASISLSNTLRHDGALAEAVAVATAGARECRGFGLDFAEGALCRQNAAEAAFELGDWGLVEQLTREELEHGATGMARAWALQNRIALDVARGDFAAARERDAEQRALDTQMVPERAAYMARQTAEIALWRGEPEQALEHAEQAARAVAGSDATLAAELVALALRANADVAAQARARRDDIAAAAATTRARRLREAACDPAAVYPALRATLDAELARAAGHDHPVAWAAAVNAWDARRSPYPASYARLRLAEALLGAGGDRAAAAEVLRRARADTAALQARPLGDQLASLARRARLDVGVGRLEPAGDDLGLTAREHEVLARLALGETNRQVAAELFISIKTVGAHVAHIFEKLGASTRGEAVAIARRRELP